MSAPLSEVFLARAQRDLDSPSDRAVLDQRLARLWHAGRDAWPGVELPPAELALHLAARLPAGAAIDRFLETTHATDLYLACACDRNIPRAIALLEERFLSRLPRLLGAMGHSPAFVADAVQAVRVTLLLARPERPPAIGDYSGRGSLWGWLRVVAARAALSLLPSAERRADEQFRSDVFAALSGQADVEAGYLKERYRKDFEESLRAAFDALTGKQRTLLRLHHVDRLTTIQIGALFHVDQSTASRWLKSCHETLAQTTKTLFCRRHQLAPSEYESIARLVQSQLYLSMGALLRD